MIALTYRKQEEDGVRYLPIKRRNIPEAKKNADNLYKQGYLNVRVVEIEEKVLYEPEVR